MIAADATLVEQVRACGEEVVDARTLSMTELRRVELVVVGATDAWERLRAWRAGGLTVGVVVVGASPPEDRARLEPLVLIARPDRPSLTQARERLAVAELAACVPLAGGVVDLHRSVFRRADGTVHRLTGLEVRLLGYLAARSWRAVGREELQEQVWEHRALLETRAVEVTVLRLRKKLEPDPARPLSLLTVRGEGYRVVRLTGPAEPERDPTPVRELVGRAALLAGWAEECRLPGILVLSGPAGVGKSTLLRALARELSAACVDLDAAPSEPWTAIAVGLGVAVPAQGSAVLAIAAALRDRQRAVLCVDHADLHLEALARAAQELVEQGIGVVVATRKRPSWVGARLREVPPLEPEDAVRLLADRSGVGGEELLAIVERLDRMPLAIELVAARLSAVGPRELLRALSDRGSLWLVGEGHRHASVRDAVAWSLDRAAPGRLELLAKLAVFRGAFDGPAALEVAGALPLDLMALVEEGLLSTVDRRFRVLHAVREYLTETAPASVAAVHDAWVRSVVGRASAAEARLEGSNGRLALAELRSMVADLRAVVEAGPPAPDARRVDAVLALERVLSTHGTLADRRALLGAWLAVTSDDPVLAAKLGMRLAGADFHGARDAALGRLDQAARDVAGVDPKLSARLALQAVAFAHAQGGPRDVLERLARVDPRLWSAPDRWRAEAFRVRARAKLGEVSPTDQIRILRDLVDRLLEEGLLHRASEVVLRLASVLLNEDTVAADQLLATVAARVDDLVDPAMRCSLLVCHAQALGELGQTGPALALLDRAERAIANVDPVRRWLVAHVRGRVDLAGGRYDEARTGLERCLDWWESHDWSGGAYDQLEQLAILELAADRPNEAAAWAGRALALARGLGDPMISEAATWAACAACLGGDRTGLRAALVEVRPEVLPPDRRLAFFACNVAADAGDRTAAAQVAALRARIPSTHPVRRIAEAVLAG